MIKAVIFDFDGTIADTVPLCIAAFRKAIEPLTGKSISDADIIAAFGPSEEGTIMALIPDFYEQGISNYLKYYKELHEMCPEPFDGIKGIIQYLKDNNIITALVTGKGENTREVSKYHPDQMFLSVTEFKEYLKDNLSEISVLHED